MSVTDVHFKDTSGEEACARLAVCQWLNNENCDAEFFLW